MARGSVNELGLRSTTFTQSVTPTQTCSCLDRHTHTHTQTDRQACLFHWWNCWLVAWSSQLGLRACVCMRNLIDKTTHISECIQSTQTCMLVSTCLDRQTDPVSYTVVKPEQLKIWLTATPSSLSAGEFDRSDSRQWVRPRWRWASFSLALHKPQSIHNIKFFPDGCVDIISYKQLVSMCEQLAIVLDR